MIAAGKVVEPLVDLYKVEVRELAEQLGIPRHLIARHPFPGPGLGVRLLCNSGEDDRSNFEQIEPALVGLGSRFDLQLLALPIRSVGVKADLRAYEHPVMLSGNVPWETLIEATAVTTADVPGLNRCIWNLGPTAPTRAHARPATMTRARLDLLREADHLVMQALERHGFYDEVWQCPTVLVPVDLDDSDGELLIVRPVRSARGMTAQPVQLPAALLDELRDRILELPGITGLALDVTSKPPGTIEWE